MNDLSNYLENQHCAGENRLPARSPVIPALKEGIYYKNKEESDLLVSLNGDYAFRYSSEDDTPDFFGTDFDASSWDSIDVPSMWQFRNYGKPRYTNIPYPFPFDPPYISCENPVGYYRRTFTLSKITGTAILHFAGVENAFFVYLNGEYAGFSKGSRNAAEFDVSSFVRKGENVLCVKVFTYSDASYLEGQDMLLVNGIFRDVYLLQTGEVYVNDFRVTNDLRSFTVRVDLSYNKQPGYSVAIDVDGQSQTFAAAEEITARFTPRILRLWTAETPELYPLTIRLIHNGEVIEVHSKKIGMLRSEIKDGRFLVNGSPVFIKGVNRHEYDCENGRALSRENIEKELRMIKDNNLNAVRTSHYPNDPVTYEICSEIGLYVMDEADIETHGCDSAGNMNYLTDDGTWLEAYLDRTKRMLELDKNEPCVFIHSMGNEFGEGENNRACQRLAMEFAPDILAVSDHDCGWEFLTQKEPHDEKEHFIRTGYLSEKQMQELDESLPLYMQIEYGHGMGNGPGFLEGYRNFADTHEKCYGGFVWEFKNHGFRKVNADGTTDYLYGGDFGDKDLAHASNFCLDGYLLSDRTPKHTWYELGAVSAPARIACDGENICVKNTYDFLTLDGAECEVALQEDGEITEKALVSIPAVAPRTEYAFPVPSFKTEKKAGAAYYYNVNVMQCGKTLGKMQYSLGTVQPKMPYSPEKGRLSAVRNSFDKITVTGEEFTAVFKNGLLTRFEKDGIILVDSPLDFNFMRAPIDNDLIRNLSSDMPGNKWENALLHTAAFSLRKSEIINENGKVTVKASGKALPQTYNYGVDIEIEYRITPDGLINVSVNGTPYGSEWNNMPVPRIGMRVMLKKSDCVLTWLGRGPRENWPDCHYNSPVGLYTLPVSESYTVFDRPQETGNHGDVRFLSIGDGSGAGLCVIGSDTFSFTAHDFSPETLRKAMHRSDLKKDGNTYLYVDHAVRGLGSRSCGPDPEPAFELYMRPFSFSFTLTGNLSREKMLTLCRSEIF